jgi:hypothetical protein
MCGPEMPWPLSGLLLMSRIENSVEAIFHGGVPEDCPTGEGRQDFLRAMALIALIKQQQQRRRSAPVDTAGESADLVPTEPAGAEASTSGGGAWGPSHHGPFWEGDLVRAGDRAEVIIVIDLETLLNGLHDRSIIDNGHGVDLPVESYRRLACAIPGCRVKVRHCQPHHLTFFTGQLGPTDLDNLLHSQYVALGERHAGRARPGDRARRIGHSRYLIASSDQWPQPVVKPPTDN